MDFLKVINTATVTSRRFQAALPDRRTEHWAGISRVGKKKVLPLSLLRTYAVLTFLHCLITLLGYEYYCHYVLSTQQTRGNTCYCP